MSAAAWSFCPVCRAAVNLQLHPLESPTCALQYASDMAARHVLVLLDATAPGGGVASEAFAVSQLLAAAATTTPALALGDRFALVCADGDPVPRLACPPQPFAACSHTLVRALAALGGLTGGAGPNYRCYDSTSTLVHAGIETALTACLQLAGAELHHAPAQRTLLLLMLRDSTPHVPTDEAMRTLARLAATSPLYVALLHLGKRVDPRLMDWARQRGCAFVCADARQLADAATAVAQHFLSRQYYAAHTLTNT
jgi:hypothetical protein